MLHRSRRGAAVTVILILLALSAVVAAIVLWSVYGSSSKTRTNIPETDVAFTGPYENIVVEEGEVESSNNVEVRCEVKAKGSAGTNILWVIEAATLVKKGELLVELDSSGLKDELSQQQIVCNTTLALKIQADNVYQAAKIAKTEYLEGAYEQERQAILSEIFIAEENLRRARQYAQYSERLAAKGYVTALQLEGDRFAVDKAQNELDLAKRKLHVLEDYTKAKTLKTLDADIAIAEAKLESETESYEVELQKLEDLKTQVERCKIYSPADGQVVHANEFSSRGGSEFVVEPGATVREGQTIIRIPDPTSMQVNAKINESRITSVTAGMPVTIQIDALGNKSLQGEVITVNKYAEPTSWFMSSVKKYGTTIRIHNPPDTLRPGLTAQVRIFVERQPSVLQVPVQAVYDHGSATYALVQNGDDYETREIAIDSSNDKTVVIKSGLKVGDVVVKNPRSHIDLFNLPQTIAEPGLTSFASFNDGEPGSPSDGPRNGPPGEGGPPREGRPDGEGGPQRGPGRGGPGNGGPGNGGPGNGGPGNGGGRLGAGGDFNPASIVSQRFAELDKDGDGKIALSEIPADQQGMISRSDTNSDGEITRDEMLKALEAVKARMESQQIGAQ